MQGAVAGFLAAGKIFQLHFLCFSFRPVIDDQTDRLRHRHHPVSGGIQAVPNAGFQQRRFHHGICLGYADAGKEIPYGFGRISPAAHGAQSRHTGIVPPGDDAFLHQHPEFALAHDGIGQIQPGKLDLPGFMGKLALLHYPIVQGPVDLVLQAAQTVGHALQRILNGMGKIIHGVDAPLIPGLMMAHMENTIQRRIPQIDVGRSHVYLGPKGMGSIGKFSVLHPGKELQILLYGAIPPGAVLSGLCQGAPIGFHFFF